VYLDSFRYIPFLLEKLKMRPNMLDIDVADASLTGFASNVTGAAFTLTATAATDGLAHQVSIRNDSVTDHSGKTVTLVGTDQNGAALTEVVTAPGTSATVESTGYFLTLTSATPSATIDADTFDIGWVDEVAGVTYPLNWRSPYATNVAVDVTGTINFTVQQTFTNVLGGESPLWSDITALASKTADTVSTAAVGATAIRVLVNSYSSGAELQVYTSQADHC
jgi:hypothetical protein